MASGVDYYKVLGVSRDASPEEIRRAYRRLARQCHPDVNQGDPSAEEQFKRLTEAYRVLSDPDLRERYDRTGSVEAPVDEWVGDPFGDIFDLMEDLLGFGPRQRRRARQRGRDVEAEVVVTLAEVVRGARKTLRYRRMVPCDDCGGTGCAGGGSPEVCPTCRGHGRVRYVQTYFFAEVSTAGLCPECGGRGVVIRDPCPRCRGRGLRAEMQEVEIEIPPGVEDGETMVAEGYGDFPANGRGQPGDLIVRVRVEQHPLFQRRGADLVGRVEVNAAQAALGGRIVVEGVDGPVEVEIPAGSQPGDEIVVRGAGLPRRDRPNVRGDMRLRLAVTIPRPRSRRERELLEELRRLWDGR